MDKGKSFARTLAAGLDRLTFVAEQTKTGVRVFATYTERESRDGKIVTTRGPERGAHDKVADMTAAKAWIQARIDERTASGWAESPRKAFERKPDAFGLDSLPAPRVKAAATAKPAAPVAARPVQTPAPRAAAAPSRK